MGTPNVRQLLVPRRGKVDSSSYRMRIGRRLRAGLRWAMDTLLSPITVGCCLWLLKIRNLDVAQMPISRKLFRKLGVFPLRDHIYEPLFCPRHLRCSPDVDQELPGIDLNVDQQLELFATFDYEDELDGFPRMMRRELEYYYDNGTYESGDAELLYSMIRHFKPRRIIEIGAGMSTLMALNAIRANVGDDPSYTCRHLCIEPYGPTWLERLDIEVVRKKVEQLDVEVFGVLKENDLLLIDSSHMIRPGGDVLFEYLQILPTLNVGVLVQSHDIFIPREYPLTWIRDRMVFWNEQYLLEAFLTFNERFKVAVALNYLWCHHASVVREKFPVLRSQEAQGREPAAFWVRRVT